MTIAKRRMNEPARASADVPVYPCPSCANAIIIGPQQGPVQCPHCGHQFLPALELESGSIEIATPSQPTRGADDDDDNDELSELRIRNIANLRRGAYRSRSWLIIAAGMCLVGAARFVQIIIVAVRNRLFLAAIGDALFALAALVIVGILVRKIAILTREIRNSLLRDPADPPDFAQLGDGSQRWKDLENLSNGDGQ